MPEPRDDLARRVDRIEDAIVQIKDGSRQRDALINQAVDLSQATNDKLDRLIDQVSFLSALAKAADAKSTKVSNAFEKEAERKEWTKQRDLAEAKDRDDQRQKRKDRLLALAGTLGAISTIWAYFTGSVGAALEQAKAFIGVLR